MSSLKAHTEYRVFAELSGIVLMDPEMLDVFHHGRARGRDLLELYSTSEMGDAVAASGVVIPVLGLEPAFYSVVVRPGSALSSLSGEPLTASFGWVLRVASGYVVIAGLGYLKHWHPEHAKLRRVPVPVGWYSVVVSMGAAPPNDDFALEFALTPSTSPPSFSADVGQRFGEALAFSRKPSRE